MIHRRHTIAIYVAALIAVCDQLSKWWIENVMMQPPHNVPVTSFFNLVLWWNKGVTFGLLDRYAPGYIHYFLIATTVIILALLLRWLWRTHSTVVAIGLGLIMGGAIGNVIDRLRFGAVADFLDFYVRIYGKEQHWPAFNLADSAIVLGVMLLLLDGLVRGR